MIRHTLLDPKVWDKLKKLPALGETDGMTEDRPAVRLFHTFSNASWTIWEYDPQEQLAFGLCDLGSPEIGYVSLSEMSRMQQWIERDTSVDTLTEGYKAHGITPPSYVVAAGREFG